MINHGLVRVFVSLSLMTNGDEHLFVFLEQMCAVSCELRVVVVIIFRFPPLVYNLLCVRNGFKPRTAFNPENNPMRYVLLLPFFLFMYVAHFPIRLFVSFFPSSLYALVF